jgi:hypothetical protein
VRVCEPWPRLTKPTFPIKICFQNEAPGREGVAEILAASAQNDCGRCDSSQIIEALASRGWRDECVGGYKRIRATYALNTSHVFVLLKRNKGLNYACAVLQWLKCLSDDGAKHQASVSSFHGMTRSCRGNQ